MFGRPKVLLFNFTNIIRERRTFVRNSGGLLLRSLLHCVLAVGIMFVMGRSAWSETDMLIRMVGLALTGGNDLDAKVIGDRTNCVFAIKNDLFRLNNVYADRINVRTYQPHAGNPRTWITLTLQGDETVFEQTLGPTFKDDDSKLMRELRTEDADIFQPRHYTYTEYELHLTTDNQDGVKKAWQYIYSHGCTGKQSPS
ncbi:MAG: hypothetical protein WA728_10375 [Xanthobacteraceae bacterium]